MPVDLITEEELRSALRPLRRDPQRFEAAVRERIDRDAERPRPQFAPMSPLLRVVASFLPLEVLTAGEISQSALRTAPLAGGLSKFLGYALFPAVSFLLLVGSAIFGVASISRIRHAGVRGITDEEKLRSMDQWWLEHKREAVVVLVATMALPLIGATWLLFLFYIVSALILVYVLKNLAKFGVGNRVMVGQACSIILAFLGQTAVTSAIVDREIHFIDRSFLFPVFCVGSMAISIFAGITNRHITRWPNWRGVLPMLFLFASVLVLLSPILFPMKSYVESFDRAPFSSASWAKWEVVATAVQEKTTPDLTRPQRLFDRELQDKGNTVLPFIMKSALKAGLVQRDRVPLLPGYEEELREVFSEPDSLSLDPQYYEWLVRAAVLHDDLTPDQRDILEKRLHIALKRSLDQKLISLNTPLLATQLLAVLGRPVDPALYQAEIHALLMRCHGTTGIFSHAGGFSTYDDGSLVGDLNGTAEAVQLMETYGVPKELDLNWVRSFLRPSVFEFSPDKWIRAVMLDRANHLPGATQPSWFEFLYAERSFVAAVILVGLCFFATAISPRAIEAKE